MPVVNPERPHRPDEDDDDIIYEEIPEMDFPPQDQSLRKEYIFKGQESGNGRSAEYSKRSLHAIRKSTRWSNV